MGIKSEGLQSCPTGPLCHLASGIKSTSPGQRWAGSRACMLSRFSHVRFFVTPWTVAHQAPLSMGFSRQEHWGGLPFPFPGDLPNPGIEPASLVSPALPAGSLPLASPGKPRSKAALRKREGQKMWETKAPLTYSITLNTKYLLSSILGYMPGTRWAYPLPSLISRCIPCTLD